jgi:hypothetical protein
MGQVQKISKSSIVVNSFCCMILPVKNTFNFEGSLTMPQGWPSTLSQAEKGCGHARIVCQNRMGARFRVGSLRGNLKHRRFTNKYGELKAIVDGDGAKNKKKKK